MGKRATIRDVAERAGVSKSTVSLVLHNSPLVRSETKDAVHHAIEQLNYVRNHAAASLRSSNSGRIGIVVNDLCAPFLTDFVAAAQQALMARGYAALIAHSGDDSDAEYRAVNQALEQDSAGLLIAPCYDKRSPVFDTILAARIPAMQVLRQRDNRLDAIPFHSLDYAIGSHLAAQHLLDQGLRRIVFVGGLAGDQIVRERAAGYSDVMEVSGQRPMFVHGGDTRSFGQQAMQRLAKEHPDAVAAICINDQVALGMADAAPRIGRTVGRDFFIVGIDDIPECQTASPPLSSIRCDVASLAEKSVEALLAWIESGTHPQELVRRPVKLMVRASSQRP